MFCPSCRDEFRPEFTRCARCDVDLVEDLSRVESAPPRSAASVPSRPARMIDYCGYFSMEEAAGARGLLRESGIRTEIVLREGSGDEPGSTPDDEYWLRVDADRIADVRRLIDPQPPAAEDEEATFGCSECGQLVPESADFCPRCGSRFEE